MDATTDAAIAPHLSRRQMRRILDRYRVVSGEGFRLRDFDPADTAGHLLTKPQAGPAPIHKIVSISALT